MASTLNAHHTGLPDPSREADTSSGREREHTNQDHRSRAGWHWVRKRCLGAAPTANPDERHDRGEDEPHRSPMPAERTQVGLTCGGDCGEEVRLSGR
jgi:hypothetical protein